MKGEPIESVKVGLQTMVSSLRQDPFALESVYLSLITFDRDAQLLVPLTGIEEFRIPDVVTPDSGPTLLGKCLELLCKRVDSEVLRGNDQVKGDWRPLLFIMTDGCPSDILLYKQMIPEIKKRKFAKVVACAAGDKAKHDVLMELADEVVSLDTTDSASFMQFFKWVSASVSSGNLSMGASSLHLPAPPSEVHVVI